MPVNSMTYNFDSLLSTTWMNYRDKLYDNIFNACPFFYWIHANERKKVHDGGERIVINLEYGKNSTIKSMTNGYDTIDTTPQDSITSAYYEWKEIAGSTTISNRELALNQGKNKIIDLLQSKANNTEMSMTEELTRQMIGSFTAGNGGHDLTPLNLLVKKDPTTSTTIGGINQSTYTWWRNKYTSSSATTFAAFASEIAHLYNQCSKGGSKGKRSFPDMGLTDQLYYELYEAMARAKGQIMLVNEPIANLGFGGAKYKGMTLMWDEWLPDIQSGTAITDPDTYTWSQASALFLNSEFIELSVCKGQDFIIGPFIQPENQKAKTSIIYMMAEVTTSNRAKHGVHFNVDETIAA